MNAFDNQQGAGWIDPVRFNENLGARPHSIHSFRGVESWWSAALIDSALLILLISLFRDASPIETLRTIYAFIGASVDAVSAWMSAWSASQS